MNRETLRTRLMAARDRVTRAERAEEAAAQSAGWNESTINAMGATACAKKWGVKEGTSAFDRACAEYNRGVVASLRERATRTARSDDEV